MAKQAKKAKKTKAKKAKPKPKPRPKEKEGTIDLQEITETLSSQDSPPLAPPPQIQAKPAVIARDLQEFITYVQTQWHPHAVAMHLRLLSMQSPTACPATILWDIPRNMDIPDLVHGLMQDPAYLVDIYPVLCMMLKDSIKNYPWACSVATTFALYDIARTIQ